MPSLNFDHVFTGKWEGEVVPDPEEISEVSWMEFSDIEQGMMARPGQLQSMVFDRGPEGDGCTSKQGAVTKDESKKALAIIPGVDIGAGAFEIFSKSFPADRL